MAKIRNKSYPEDMALSDRERRLLAEMEAALASDDPRLQSTLSGDTATLIRRAPGGALAGLILVLRSFAGKSAGSATGIGKLRSPKAPRSFGARLQERWDRRTFE